jgi:hypothetical protein
MRLLLLIPHVWPHGCVMWQIWSADLAEPDCRLAMFLICKIVVAMHTMALVVVMMISVGCARSSDLSR